MRPACLLLQLQALALLRPDVQQGHPGVLHAQETLGIVRPHVGKLHEVLRGALGGGAAVDEHHLPVRRGDHGGQRRPADTPDALNEQGRRREQCPRRAGRDKCIALLGLEQVQTHRHGGVRLVLKGAGGIILHGDDLAGRGDLHALGQVRLAELRQAVPNDCLRAGQNNFNAQIFRCAKGTLHRGQGGVVAAHGVHNNFHKFLPFLVSASPAHPGLPKPAGTGRRSCSACPSPGNPGGA